MGSRSYSYQLCRGINHSPTIWVRFGDCSLSNTIFVVKVILLYISFPHQLLHALAAVKHEQLQNQDLVNIPKAILIWCYDAAQHLPNSPFRQQFAALLRGYPEIDVWMPNYIFRVVQLSPFRSVSTRAGVFKRWLANRSVALVAYSHDMSADHTAQALFQACPFAWRMCFGDPPGFLYSNQEIQRTTLPNNSFFRRLMGGAKPLDDGFRWLYANSNRIPIVFGTPTTSGLVTQIPITVLLETLELLRSGLVELQYLCRRWLEENTCPLERPCLLLLSNLTETGITTRESEVDLYRSIVRSSLPAGSHIFIKPHPGTSNRMLGLIKLALRDYRISILPSHIGFAPVEILAEFVDACRIYSISSASVLLIKLFNSNIETHCLTNDLIKAYFKPQWQDYFIRANDAIIKAINSRQDDLYN